MWDDPTSSDPTHSLLSKDHFSNILNQPAGQVAAIILQYVAPRVIYGWDHPEVPEQEILGDIARVFHHPAAREPQCEIHRQMFGVVEKWVHERPDRGQGLDQILSSASVKAGKNHVVQNFQQSLQPLESQLQGFNTGSHSNTAGGPFAMFAQQRSLDAQSQGGGTYGYSGGSTGAGPQDYAQASYTQGPPEPAGFAAEGGSAYPTAYQQGYEAPYEQTQQQPEGGYQGQQHDGEYGRDERYGSNYEQHGGYSRY